MTLAMGRSRLMCSTRRLAGRGGAGDRTLPPGRPRVSRLAWATTNADGRLDGPILDRDAFTAGVYELRFRAGGYLRGRTGCRIRLSWIRAIRFGIARRSSTINVPLLLSPYGYSTYRGKLSLHASEHPLRPQRPGWSSSRMSRRRRSSSTISARSRARPGTKEGCGRRRLVCLHGSPRAAPQREARL